MEKRTGKKYNRMAGRRRQGKSFRLGLAQEKNNKKGRILIEMKRKKNSREENNMTRDRKTKNKVKET